MSTYLHSVSVLWFSRDFLLRNSYVRFSETNDVQRVQCWRYARRKHNTAEYAAVGFWMNDKWKVRAPWAEKPCTFPSPTTPIAHSPPDHTHTHIQDCTRHDPPLNLGPRTRRGVGGTWRWRHGKTAARQCYQLRGNQYTGALETAKVIAREVDSCTIYIYMYTSLRVSQSLTSPYDLIENKKLKDKKFYYYIWNNDLERSCGVIW